MLLGLTLGPKFEFLSYLVKSIANKKTIIKLIFYCSSKICMHFTAHTELNYLNYLFIRGKNKSTWLSKLWIMYKTLEFSFKYLKICLLS